MSSSITKLRRWFHLNHFVYIFTLLLVNEMIVETWQQIQFEHPDSASQYEQVKFNYHQGDEHHIVKRKLKMKSIMGGKSRSRPKPKPQSNPYPKQPSHNPAYSSGSSNPYPKQPSHNPNYPAGPPPAYPGSSHSGHSAGAPPPYPGSSHSGYPAGPPPPYPGSSSGHGYPQQSNYPRYPQQSAQNPYPGCKYYSIL